MPWKWTWKPNWIQIKAPKSSPLRGGKNQVTKIFILVCLMFQCQTTLKSPHLPPLSDHPRKKFPVTS